jgi:hypothetical protein
MIPVLFVGIAIMFLCLAGASHVTKSLLKKPHRHIIDVIDREIARSKKQGAEGWGSATTYLYKTINTHFWLEIAGFVMAAIAASLEYLLAIGWL